MKRRLSAVLLAAGLTVSALSMGVYAEETETTAAEQVTEAVTEAAAESKAEEMLEEAESVMETCYNNWIYTSREGLKRALRESEDMPMIWNILAGGYIYEGGEGNNVPNTRTGPSVDINAMRDGMGN